MAGRPRPPVLGMHELSAGRSSVHPVVVGGGGGRGHGVRHSDMRGLSRSVMSL